VRDTHSEGDNTVRHSEGDTFTRRCTVLCNRPMFRSTGVYTCDFKIDEGRQVRRSERHTQ
jgi:hypothetical protein